MRTLSLFLAAFVPAAVPPVQASSVTSAAPKPRPQVETTDVKTRPVPVVAERRSLIAEAASGPAAPVAVVAPRAGKTAAQGAVTRTFDRVCVDSSCEDGVLWARGRSYKASFGGEGITYIPFFGSDAPRNFPTHFALRAVRVGNTTLAFDRDARPVLEADCVHYDRGGVIEQWELAVENVEQRFTFHTLPTHGDLVLEIALDSELAIAESPTGISFTNELGRVDYSKAVAIDAAGSRFAVEEHVIDGAIELRLASEHLAQACLPLVIDPFVASFSVTQTANEDFGPDVAYEAVSDRYVTVFEEVFSVADHDVWAEIRDGQGTSVTFSSIDTSTAYWSGPRVASSGLSQSFFCVAAVGIPGQMLRTIQGRAITPTGSVAAPVTIAGTDSYDKWAPDVGGDPATTGSTFFCVVWERTFSPTDHDIHARLVPSTGGNLSGTIFLDNSNSTLDNRPAISKSDGHPPAATQDWTVVWQRWYPAGNHWQVFGAHIHQNGVVTHGTFPIDATSDVVRNPRVSSLLDDNGGSRPYMVVFEAQNPFNNDWDILGTIFIGTTFMSGTSIPDQVGSNQALDQGWPCVDSDGRHFAVAYRELFYPQQTDYDIVVADMLYADNYPFLCDWASMAATSFSENRPSICANYSGNGARERSIVAWDKNDFQVGPSQAWIGLYDGCASGAAKAFCVGDGTHTACPCSNDGLIGSGCENSSSTGGGFMSWSGNDEVGNDTFVLYANALPLGSASLYFQGFPATGGVLGAAFGDGILCLPTQIVRLGVKFNPTGSSQYPDAGDTPLSIAGSIPSSGKHVFYQVWYRDSAAFCTSATYNLTSGIEAVWAPY